MSEWLKEHAWKACVSQNGTVGSNPTLSAIYSPCMANVPVGSVRRDGFGSNRVRPGTEQP